MRIKIKIPKFLKKIGKVVLEVVLLEILRAIKKGNSNEKNNSS